MIKASTSPYRLVWGELWDRRGCRRCAKARLGLAFIPEENPEKLLGDIKVISAWLAKEIGAPGARLRDQ